MEPGVHLTSLAVMSLMQQLLVDAGVAGFPVEAVQGTYSFSLDALNDNRHLVEHLLGLSPAELSQLRAGDYDAATNSIGIGQRADFRVKQPSRRRWVPLCEEALALWHQPTKPFEPPFPRVPAMQAAMSRARASGAPAITPKVMRKWFASQVSGSAPEHVLQRLLGHAPGSKVTRRHYVRSSDSATAAAVVGLSIPQGARA